MERLLGPTNADRRILRDAVRALFRIVDEPVRLDHPTDKTYGASGLVRVDLLGGQRQVEGSSEPAAIRGRI